MLRARSRCEADRPTYDTLPRRSHGRSRSSVAFHAHDRGLVKSGDCIAMTRGKLRVVAPPGASTTPLMTVCISESGGVEACGAGVFILTRVTTLSAHGS